jgi:serine/threonine protein kinase
MECIKGGYGVVYLDDDKKVHKAMPINDLEWVRDIAIPNYLNGKVKVTQILDVIVKSKEVDIYMKRYKPIDFLQYEKKQQIRILNSFIQSVKNMHFNHIIHGDLTHNNVMLDGDDLIIIDFSCSLLNVHSIKKFNSTVKEFRAPEWWEHQIVTHKIDIWSMACTIMYFLGIDFEIFNYENYVGKDPDIWINNIKVIQKLLFTQFDYLSNIIIKLDSWLEPNHKKRSDFGYKIFKIQNLNIDEKLFETDYKISNLHHLLKDFKTYNLTTYHCVLKFFNYNKKIFLSDKISSELYLELFHLFIILFNYLSGDEHHPLSDYYTEEDVPKKIEILLEFLEKINFNILNWVF